VRLIKVFSGVLSGTIVKVVEHEIHIFLFFDLQVIVYFSVAMHLYFNMCVCLTTNGARLRKVSDLLRDNSLLSRLPRG
jgi:hypothetical protein